MSTRDVPLAWPRGGAVQRGELYIGRTVDGVFENHAAGTTLFYVRGSRTMGKTSLLWRHFRHAERREDHRRMVWVDIRSLGDPIGSFDDWLTRLEDSLRADAEANGVEFDDLTVPADATAGRRLVRVLLKLGKAGVRTLIALDEIDWIRNYSFRGDVVSALTTCQAFLATQQRRNVGLCLVGFGDIEDLGGPEFRPIVPVVAVDDFPHLPTTRRQIAALLPGQSRDEIASFVLSQTGGQPYLTMSLARQISESFPQGASREDAEVYVENFVQMHRDELGLGHSHGTQSAYSAERVDFFRNVQAFFLSQKSEPVQAFRALQLYRGLLSGPHPVIHPNALRFLIVAGLIRVDDGAPRIKGELFKRVFDAAWVESVMPELDEHCRGHLPGRLAYAAPALGDMPRLCLLNAGGSVGMVYRDGRVVAPQGEEDFFEHYPDMLKLSKIGLAHVSYREPFEPTDSINIVPRHWSDLAREIFRLRQDEGFDGFIVAHGTDTMAFTASAVAFALGSGLDFPVVFTGSQTTPNVLHGDGQMNLLRAALLATLGKDLPEVVIAFGSFVYRAVRAHKRDERRFEGFESPAYPPIAEITEVIEMDAYRTKPFVRVREGSNTPIRVFRERVRRLDPTQASLGLRPNFADAILLIQLTPGLEPEFYKELIRQSIMGRLAHQCRGVVLQTLGAGNITNHAPFEFISFIEYAVGNDIPVLVTSPYPWSPELSQEFEPAAAAVKYGAIPAGEMTSAAAVTKFRWAIAQVDADVSRGGKMVKDGDQSRCERVGTIMTHAYVGELTEVDSVDHDPEAGGAARGSLLHLKPQQIP